MLSLPAGGEASFGGKSLSAGGPVELSVDGAEATRAAARSLLE